MIERLIWRLVDRGGKRPRGKRPRYWGEI